MTSLYSLLLALLAFALLLSPTAMAQTEDCPRVWRVFEALHTDDAPRIQWLKAGQPDTVLLGATQSFFMPVDSGAYRVEVWGEVSTPFQWNPEDFKPEWFRIYPNPFQDTLRVLTNALHPAKLELIYLDGRIVLQAEIIAPSTDIDAR